MKLEIKTSYEIVTQRPGKRWVSVKSLILHLKKKSKYLDNMNIIIEELKQLPEVKK